jgi:hypothetical protein
MSARLPDFLMEDFSLVDEIYVGSEAEVDAIKAVVPWVDVLPFPAGWTRYERTAA